MLGRMEEEARLVLDALLERGYEAYFVGGCVRDAVLKRPIKDIDIATSARPEQVIACFPRTAPTGLQHGTVTVLMPQYAFEVTTFRTESQYEAFRRPKEVAYITDLNEDLRRRDFTMNAMAMDRDGRMLDPFGGQKDLEAGLLRCVGEAKERFHEDALRMLRCIRFASVYGLEIEAATWQALLEQAPLLRHIAMERVRSELQRMVEGSAPARAVRLLLASRLWQHFKRALGLPFEKWLAQPGALDAVSALEQQRPRWALLLLLLETPADEVRAALQELTFSRADTDAVCAVLALHEALVQQTIAASPEAVGEGGSLASLERVWKTAAVRHGLQTAEAWLDVMRALLAQPAPDQPPAASAALAEFLRTTAPLLVQEGEGWLRGIPCASLKHLAVTGSDLMKKLRRPAGPWLGAMLHELLERVALGELPNEAEALLQEAARNDYLNESGVSR